MVFACQSYVILDINEWVYNKSKLHYSNYKDIKKQFKISMNISLIGENSLFINAKKSIPGGDAHFQRVLWRDVIDIQNAAVE